MTVQCVNPDCPEFELSKSLGFELLPGEVVSCGGCGRDCQLVEPDPEPR